MLNKLRKHKKIMVPILVMFTVVISFFGYREYDYGAFKRAYENGTVYEQLIVLTGYGRVVGGKRYVEAVRKAGYEIDEYNLSMNDFITSLTTKELGIKVVPAANDIKIWFNYQLNNQPIRVFQILSKDIELQSDGGYTLLDESGHDKERIQLSEDEQEQLREVAENELKAMLKDIYDSMYPEGK
ncbi:hypothetical protein ACTGZQ_08070 [Streptococcus suis]